MEESKALHKLAEAQDLVGMVEEMLSPESTERLSPAAWSGLRITLRAVREIIGASHAAMAGELVQRSKTLASTQAEALAERATRSAVASQMTPASASPIVSASSAAATSGMGSTDSIRANPGLSRRDLKASLERLVDRGN